MVPESFLRLHKLARFHASRLSWSKQQRMGICYGRCLFWWNKQTIYSWLLVCVTRSADINKDDSPQRHKPQLSLSWCKSLSLRSWVTAVRRQWVVLFPRKRPFCWLSYCWYETETAGTKDTGTLVLPHFHVIWCVCMYSYLNWAIRIYGNIFHTYLNSCNEGAFFAAVMSLRSLIWVVITMFGALLGQHCLLPLMVLIPVQRAECGSVSLIVSQFLCARCGGWMFLTTCGDEIRYRGNTGTEGKQFGLHQKCCWKQRGNYDMHLTFYLWSLLYLASNGKGAQGKRQIKHSRYVLSNRSGRKSCSACVPCVCAKQFFVSFWLKRTLCPKMKKNPCSGFGQVSKLGVRWWQSCARALREKSADSWVWSPYLCSSRAHLFLQGSWPSVWHMSENWPFLCEC